MRSVDISDPAPSPLDFAAPAHTLLGARAAEYAGVKPTTEAGLTDHERRIGRRVHLGQAFAQPGKVPLTKPDEVAVARRADTALIQCWKPTRRWRDAGGNDPHTTTYITKVAQAIARSGGRVLLTIHHEPENDVGSYGTAADYVNMFRHVKSVFTDQGVTNALFVIGFMNYPKWDDLVPRLWPGDDHAPDWIMFNAYGSAARPRYADNVQRFYEKLATDAWFPAAGRPWGVREWGIADVPREVALGYYRDAAAALQAAAFPLLKAHVLFDSPGTHHEVGLPIGFWDNGSAAPEKIEVYREFAHHSVFGPVAAPLRDEPLPGL